MALEQLDTTSVLTAELVCESVSKRFGGVRALEDVHVVARRGEVLGIIGPNGSGKSTLLHVITGFLKADSGSVRWQGRDITRLPVHRRTRDGLVRTFQETSVFGGSTVLENLRFPHIQRGAEVTDDELLALADRIQLPRQLLGQPAKVLSWGQSRLLGIALALAAAPLCLLLDEPFAGINRQTAQQVSELLVSLRADGIGLVIVEHEMSLLLPLCDRLVAMVDGRVAADGHPDDVLADAAVRTAYFGGVIGDA